MLPQEIIRRKRDKQELSTAEIYEFIEKIGEGKAVDSQIAALTMAILLNGLNKRETIDLTLAMRDSGEVLNWQGFDKPIVDKHSSGGVGDKVSLILAPIMAACDVYVPMISGRGLGHTGGTVDKLEAIPGYNTRADNNLFRRTVKEAGCAIIGQTGKLAPADKKIYAIRDVCATVESIPLITASILSKKLAAGLQCLVMDLKCGNGAFMRDFASAKALAESIMSVGNGAGTSTKAVLTDMNQVLGYNVGNALEVAEAVEFLQNGKKDNRLYAVTKVLCETLLVQCGHCSDVNTAGNLVDKVLDSGAAMEHFAKMTAMLGGPADFAEKYLKHLPHTAHVKPVFVKHKGYVCSMDTRAIGVSIITLKGGRSVPDQALDLATGYSEFAQIGDFVDADKPLAFVHYQSEEQYDYAADTLREAVIVSDVKPELTNPILLSL